MVLGRAAFSVDYLRWVLYVFPEGAALEAVIYIYVSTIYTLDIFFSRLMFVGCLDGGGGGGGGASRSLVYCTLFDVYMGSFYMVERLYFVGF